MDRHEIVRRAIEFQTPPRLPFWQHQVAGLPDDVCDCWEMDRQKNGWFFDNPQPDDWGCGWARTEQKNMGQVVHHPLADWSSLANLKVPDPRDPYYFARLEAEMAPAADRYVVVTSHFCLIERFHMLRGFAPAFTDFYLEPEKTERVLDMILDHKLAQFEELHKRFGSPRDGGRVHGLFLTDDWGTQSGPYVSLDVFDHFFMERYRKLFDAIHAHGWHAILHSCGRINDLVPRLIAAGVDVLNMQQPRAYGIREIGERFAGQVCFLTTADIQSTLPKGDVAAVREEVRELVENWSTPQGGFIVFNYGDPAALGVTPEVTDAMFQTFGGLSDEWAGRMFRSS